MESGIVHGESLVVPERVILAPAPGRFRPVEGGGGDTDGDVSLDDENKTVSSEQLIGFVDGVGHSTEVRSPFSGLLMGLMAHTGERVREGQPVAWMRLA